MEALKIESLREVKRCCQTCEHKQGKRATDGTYRSNCTKHNQYVSWSDTCQHWSENKNIK